MPVRYTSLLPLLQWGYTALILAATYGRTEIAQLLLNHRADVNVRDKVSWVGLTSSVLLEVWRVFNAPSLFHTFSPSSRNISMRCATGSEYS